MKTEQFRNKHLFENRDAEKMDFWAMLTGVCGLIMLYVWSYVIFAIGGTNG
jgi:hypothetical protein